MTLNLNIKADRKKAFRDAYWGDHGFLRTHFRNKHEIGGGMFRENQPNPSRISRWAEEGIKTVINLRGESEKGFYRLEREACDANGLALWNFRMHSRDTHTVTKIKAARSLFEMIEYPAVMHCKSGADRTGIMGVLFKHFKMGEPIEKAIDQLSFRYMHVKHGKTGMLDFFFEEYLSYSAKQPIEFIKWVETVYDPADVKARFMAGKVASFVTDTVLRRE
ncbi:MAG: protein tyrosine phosphatase [Hellea sp.]|nr:protein tyrosine phosphatase [Hellea sp.]